MPRRKGRQCARVVDEPSEVVRPRRLRHPVEEAVDARRAVVEPPGAAEQHRGIVPRERRKLAAVDTTGTMHDLITAEPGVGYRIREL